MKAAANNPAPVTTTSTISAGRKSQAQDREVKASTGVSVNKITDSQADALIAKGALLESSLKAQKGLQKPCRVGGIHPSTKDFAPSKNGNMTRSLGLYLDCEGMTGLVWIQEMADKPLNATAGSYITLPLVVLPAGAETVRYDGTDAAPDGATHTVYAKGGFVVAGENSSFATRTSEQELYMLAKTSVVEAVKATANVKVR